jgi:hypothetical protein
VRCSKAFFDTVAADYALAAARRVLVVMYVVPCCGPSDYKHCGYVARYVALIGAMHALAKETMARALFLADFPAEMLAEIAQHLDASSVRAWRRADPYVARTMPARAPTIDWRAIATGHTNYWPFHCSKPWATENELDYVTQLCSAACVDDVAAVAHWWAQRTRYLSKDAPIDAETLLITAIAKGNALKVWQAFPGPTFHMTERLFCEGMANGRLDLVRRALGLSLTDIFAKLVAFKTEHGRYYGGDCHPVRMMLKNRHWSHVTWFFERAKAQRIALTDTRLKTLYNACAAYGHVAILEQYPYACDVPTVHYAIAHGDTADGLNWIARHRPELLVPRRSIPNGTVKEAVRTSEPLVLQWLWERDYLEPFWRALYDQAIAKNYTRTLAWLDTALRTLSPLPEWYPQQ